jgi:hypothetical protein
MLLAVPATMLIAVSMLAAFRSGILSSAISLTFAFEIVPTLVLFGTPDPLSIPTAFFIRTEAGGVLSMNENNLS